MSTQEPATTTQRRTRITLIRHGESNVTVERIIGGRRTCSGLSDLGRQQARRLAARLAETQELDADVLLTSDFARAMETADIIRPSLDRAESTEPWPEFGEHDPGPDIDGMTFAEYVDRFGTPEWDGDPTVEIFPGGETTAEFHLRIGRALDRLLRTFPGRHVVVTCHGGVVDAVFRRAVGLPSTGHVVLNTLNTSLTDFRSPDDENGWSLVRYNDSAHLVGLPDASERATG